MSSEGNRPCQDAELDDLEQVGWTAARAMLNAQQTGNRALEDYLLLMSLDGDGSLDSAEVDAILADAIAAHREILEDLECAREAIEEFGVVETA